ncbi:GntR family transcriptional regulator [Dermabacteraceae bacterium P7074]
MKIDRREKIPPYEQVRRALLDEIVSGERLPGERLPSIRQVAADNSLAPGTVARAYKELEADGFIVARRGGGTFVSDPLPAAHMDGYELDRAALILVGRARHAGYSDTEIESALAVALRR